MAEYHVGSGWAGIYAGTLKKNGIEWLNKSVVTDEAIGAVADYFLSQCEIDKVNLIKYKWALKDGRKISLTFEIKEVQDADCD